MFRVLGIYNIDKIEKKEGKYLRFVSCSWRKIGSEFGHLSVANFEQQSLHFLCHLFHWCCSYWVVLVYMYTTICSDTKLAEIILEQSSLKTASASLLVPNSQAYLVLPINQIKE